MRALPRAVALFAWVLLGATAVRPAWAQADVNRATARTLGEAGGKALEAKDYKSAEDDFRRAESLIHAPTLLLGLARALAGQGKLVEAQETYRRVVREGAPSGSPAAFQRAVNDAAREVEGVSSRVGAVTITVKGQAGEAVNAQVTWDQVAVNGATLGVKRPADPGSHVLHVTADGYLPADMQVEVPVGGAVNTPVTLTRSATGAAPGSAGATGPGQPGSPSGVQTSATGGSGFGIWPWVAFGVGGAGLAAGAVTGFLALGKHSDLAGRCPGSVCPPDQQSNVNGYGTLGTISTVGFIVAGVGAAAGVTLLVLQPKAGAPPATGLHVVPIVGAGSLGAVGTF